MKLEDLFKAGVVQGLGYSPTSSGISPFMSRTGSVARLWAAITIRSC